MAFLIILVFVVILVFAVIPELIPNISRKVVNLTVQESDKETALRQELKLLREELQTLNMMDEFARYARTERKINVLKEQISELSKSKSEVYLKFKFGTNVIFQVVQVVVMLSMIWSLRSQPLIILPKEWLWPLHSVIAFPSGVSGGIGITCWLVVCRSVVRQISQAVKQ